MLWKDVNPIMQFERGIMDLAIQNTNTSQILNLGCGKKKIIGAVNLDITHTTHPDVVHDLNIVPWPFVENSFQSVYAYDVIEHLDHILPTMNELYRITQHNALIHITVPHFSSSNAFTDPTHQHYLSYFSFDIFNTGDNRDFYSSTRFTIVDRQIVFRPTFLNKALWRLAKRYPEKYEQRYAWIFPAWYLSFTLKTIKE
jgi:hypothetical protein